MLTLTNTEIFGVERAMNAAGNAMTTGNINTRRASDDPDLARGIRLGTTQPGSAHDHFLCGIVVQVDVKYPLYISPELQRYHWFEIITSQSTMHKLTTHLHGDCWNQYVSPLAKVYTRFLLWRYSRRPTYENMMRLRSNLPWGFEMWMTVTTNYLQLKTMYQQRKTHRLKEDWGAFCAWCDRLPHFQELTGCSRDGQKRHNVKKIS